MLTRNAVPCSCSYTVDSRRQPQTAVTFKVTQMPHLSAIGLHRNCVGSVRRPCLLRIRTSASHEARGNPKDMVTVQSKSLDDWHRLSIPFVVWLLTEMPVSAEDIVDFSKGSFAKESYYVTLGLFLITLPGLWSLIKRSPKAKIVRRVFEVPGPAVEGAVPLDSRARQIYGYFKNYNYELKSTGDVIRFVGTYQASRGQAAALVFYVFCGLASTALVLSIAVPFGGNWWYAMTLLSPLAGVYYLQKGTRDEEFAVKMVTADDDKVTDITLEGDAEEVDRMVRQLGLQEKGKVYVKGLLES